MLAADRCMVDAGGVECERRQQRLAVSPTRQITVDHSFPERSGLRHTWPVFETTLTLVEFAIVGSETSRLSRSLLLTGLSAVSAEDTVENRLGRFVRQFFAPPGDVLIGPDQE